jgi:hypothetical protein
MKPALWSVVDVRGIGRWIGNAGRGWTALVRASGLGLTAGIALTSPAGGLCAATAQMPGHLLNISTRARIGVGDDVVVCGFVITGESSRKVLVRVLGPSLRQFGVADAVADPAMQVMPVGGNTSIAANDNWRDGDAAAVTATGLAPYDPLDCALILDLAPGAYTALISGRNGGTGIALAEVYDLDEPAVGATVPVKNDATVSANTASVLFTFNRPMAPEVDLDPGTVWGASSSTWSGDRRQLTVKRISAATPLPVLGRVAITLNPVGGNRRMRDVEGNVLASYTLTFTVGGQPNAPHVVSTVPEVGTKVSPNALELVFTFSEPMTRVFGGTTGGWWPYRTEWSDDNKTMRVIRTGTEPLPPGASIFYRIGPPFYRSAAGVPMAGDFDLAFTVDMNLQRVEADPARGFQWPYYLVIPPNITAPATLLVEPNNTGTVDDNPARHELAAESLIRNRSSLATALGCPLLIPAFPRPANPPAPEPGGIYTHALDRFCLQMTGSPIERLDRQLIAMVDDARQRLATAGIVVAPRFFMTGFSASGAFTSRFALLHPDRVKAAACGSPGGWPIAPVASWQGVVLPYPCGISDVATLVGESPNLAAFVQLPLFIYVGSIDTNDAYDIRGMPAATGAAIKVLLNSPADPYIANRWPTAAAIYRSVGSVAVFKVYPGVGHSYSTEINNDLVTFFASHR